MKKITKFLDTIVIAGGYIASVLCLLLVGIVVYGVFTRYILKSVSDWTMEVSQYTYCGITLLATGYALLQDAHAKIDVFRIRFSKKTQKRLELIQYPIIISICIILIWMGGEEFWNAFTKDYRSESVLGLPLWPVWSTIPIGGFLLLLASISDCLKYFFNIENK